MYPVIEWKNNRVYMLDQRLLPVEEKIIEHTDYKQVAASIKEMVIRGAPAIGVAAAMGAALGVLNAGDRISAEIFAEITDTLAATRPTAVNLFWALEKMRGIFETYKDDVTVLQQEMIRTAIAMDHEDVEINRMIGRNGQKLLNDNSSVLTHCNAGALATAGYGTALGVVRAACEAGKTIRVYSDETRPFLQGARLTVWELQQDKIPVTLITDSMAGYAMKSGMIDAVVVGADRIAANGDVANKIGTYSVAVLADYNHIPFYVAAPMSTIDFSLQNGDEIPIEQRPKEEVINFRNQRIARPETDVFNPAFDVTPNKLVKGIITEKGVVSKDFLRGLAALREK